MKKRIFSFIICVIFLIICATPLTVTAETQPGKVNIHDYADLFTETEEKNIANHLEDLVFSGLGMDVVVLTDESYTGSIVNYTDDFYDNNGYGKDGILFFVNNDEVYVNTVGYAIIAINDAEVEDVIDAGWSYFQNYDFTSCVKYMANKASGLVEVAYNNGYVDSQIDTNIQPPAASIWVKIGKALIPSFLSIVCSAAITVGVSLFLFLKHKSVSGAAKAELYLNNNFKINNSNEIYTGSKERVQAGYYRPSSSSSGGGRSSGSSHRSSSGRSHGGGGRSR